MISLRLFVFASSILVAEQVDAADGQGNATFDPSQYSSSSLSSSGTIEYGGDVRHTPIRNSTTTETVVNGPTYSSSRTYAVSSSPRPSARGLDETVEGCSGYCPEDDPVAEANVVEAAELAAELLSDPRRPWWSRLYRRVMRNGAAEHAGNVAEFSTNVVNDLGANRDDAASAYRASSRAQSSDSFEDRQAFIDQLNENDRREEERGRRRRNE